MDRFVLLRVNDPQDGFDHAVVAVVEMTPKLAKKIIARSKEFKKLVRKDPDLVRLTFYNRSVEYHYRDDEVLTEEELNNIDDEVRVSRSKDPFPEDEGENTEYDQMLVDDEDVWWRTSSKHSEVFATTAPFSLKHVAEFAKKD